jgi:hypothetical protein
LAYLQTSAGAAGHMPASSAAHVRAFAQALAFRAAAFFERLSEAVIESRMRAVRRELAFRGIVLPETPAVIGDLPHVTLARDSELPFVR